MTPATFQMVFTVVYIIDKVCDSGVLNWCSV